MKMDLSRPEKMTVHVHVPICSIALTTGLAICPVDFQDAGVIIDDDSEFPDHRFSSCTETPAGSVSCSSPN